MTMDETLNISEKKVIVLPPGLKRKQLEDLREAGFIPIVTKNHNAVRILSADYRVDGDELLWAALQSIRGETSTSEQRKFTQLVADIIDQKLKNRLDLGDKAER